MRDGKVQYQEKAERAVRLREARRSHFKTIEAAAEFHGWSSATLSSHELGGRAFKYESAEKYAKAFGVDIDWLWNGSEGSSERPVAATSKATQRSTSRRDDLRRLENSESFLKSEMEALGLCLVHAKELLDLVQRALEEDRACRRSTPVLPKSPQEAESRKDCV
jgi:transcriptional regulator with XRE-family HTH domain